MLLCSNLRQSVLAIFSRISHNVYLLVLSFALLATLVSIITYYYARSDRILHGPDKVFEGRDFSKTPFGLMDAYDACQLEARSKLGDHLLRSHMMPMSTRYDANKRQYLVVISVDVGTAEEWNPATIYCNIDPAAEEISYYKEVREGEESILTKTMNFLSSALK